MINYNKREEKGYLEILGSLDHFFAFHISMEIFLG